MGYEVLKFIQTKMDERVAIWLCETRAGLADFRSSHGRVSMET